MATFNRSSATTPYLIELAFPDGPVAADVREDHTLALPAPALERIEGELEDAYDVEVEGLEDAFTRTYRPPA